MNGNVKVHQSSCKTAPRNKLLWIWGSETDYSRSCMWKEAKGRNLSTSALDLYHPTAILRYIWLRCGLLRTLEVDLVS
jgi:hypothetical protein